MKTCDISGMGGGYEKMCQRMLARGIAYLAEVNPPVEMWEKAKECANIYGIMLTEGQDLKALEACVIRSGDDVTTAMHQAVMQHLLYIHRNGKDKWLEKLAEYRPPADFTDYSWDGK